MRNRVNAPYQGEMAKASFGQDLLWRIEARAYDVLEWLARSFARASGTAPVRAALAPSAAPLSRANQEHRSAEIISMLMPPLPNFITAANGRRVSAPYVLRQCAGV